MSDIRARNSSQSGANQAHHNLVRLGAHDLVRSLADRLGPKLLGFIVERDASTIGRWASNESLTLPDEPHRRLLVTYQIVSMLERVEAAPTIRSWFMGMNPQLDDFSPAEGVRAGNHREVLAAARAFMAGG